MKKKQIEEPEKVDRSKTTMAMAMATAMVTTTLDTNEPTDFADPLKSSIVKVHTCNVLAMHSQCTHNFHNVLTMCSQCACNILAIYFVRWNRRPRMNG